MPIRTQIFPMSSKMLEDDNVGTPPDVRLFFNKHVRLGGPSHHPVKGRFNYLRMHPKQPTVGEIVHLLFRYQSALVAEAVLLGWHRADEHSAAGCQGYLLLDVDTVRVYGHEVTLAELEPLWPGLQSVMHRCMKIFPGDAAETAALHKFLSAR